MTDSTPHEAARLWLRLRCAGTWIRADTALADSAVAALLIEDLCWDIAHIDWATRQPRRWQRRRLERWRAEYTTLENQRDEIRATARICGLNVV